LTPVAKVAARANAKKLFLVHINPLDESDSPLDLESVAEIHSNVVTATDQMVVEIG
jgi:ribonuclease BN (tRNA processing enzyme)